MPEKANDDVCSNPSFVAHFDSRARSSEAMAEPAAGLPSLVPADGDEVRVKTGGKIRDYVSYVIDRLQSAAGASTSRVVTVTATGRAVPKAVAVAEIAKRAHGGALHQVTTIDSLETDSARRPSPSKREGTADRRRGDGTTPPHRRITVIGIALSRDEGALDAEAPGYQVPVAHVGETRRDPPTSGARSDRRRRSRGREARPRIALAARRGGETAGTEEDAGVEAATAREEADAPRRRRVRRGRGGAKKEKIDAAKREAEATAKKAETR